MLAHKLPAVHTEARKVHPPLVQNLGEGALTLGALPAHEIFPFGHDLILLASSNPAEKLDY